MRNLIYSLVATVCTTITGIADPMPDGEEDSFVEHPADGSKPIEGGLFTASGLTVKPIWESTPRLVPRDEWPDITAPTTHNQAFETPTAVWRIDGGFLGSFYAGEFGGALFFSKHGAKRWTKIVDAHVTHLERFEGDTYLAVGGLEHLTTVEGAAHLITRTGTGKWKSKVAFETQVGVPGIFGTTFTDTSYHAKSEKLIVISINSPFGWNPLFGISRLGTLHYLGERLKQNGIGPDAGGEPATPSQDGQKNDDNPQPKEPAR